jgi:hypothetical protein
MIRSDVYGDVEDEREKGSRKRREDVLVEHKRWL